MQPLLPLLLAAIMTASGRPAADQAELLALPDTGWRLVTDAVMGGVSQGSARVALVDGRQCVHLSGSVSTANNGGFIQVALEVDEDLARRAAGYDGLRLWVRGNGEGYKVHLRTRDLWLPWQSYRADFDAPADWSLVQLPFSRFEPYRTNRPLRVERLRRIGVVAIGRDFTADLCVADLALYRARGRDGD